MRRGMVVLINIAHKQQSNVCPRTCLFQITSPTADRNPVVDADADDWKMLYCVSLLSAM
jgi:hypothetical protein